MSMLRRTLLSGIAVAACLPAAPAHAASGGPGPGARAAGGDAPPVIPALVRTRVKRGERALNRLGDAVDDGDATRAARVGKVVRRQTAAAWRGAKYYIRHAPPPADEAAHLNGDGGGGPVIADAPTAALAVFQLHDDVVSDVVELTDGARGAVLNVMSRTLFFVLDARDAAIEDVRDLAPPVEDEDATAPLRARISGDEEGATFATSMPQVTAMLEDELQGIDALQSDAVDLSPGGTEILRDAEAQILLTEHKLDAYWPPVSDD